MPVHADSNSTNYSPPILETCLVYIARMCYPKIIYYRECHCTRTVPAKCSKAPVVRKLYQLLDGEQLDIVGVDPCADWMMGRVGQAEAVIEESMMKCDACKIRCQELPIRIG